MDPVYIPIVGVARTAFFAMGIRFRIKGEEYVPRTGGAVLAINHQGYLDFTFAGLALRKHRRLARFMAKKSVFEHGVTGPLMRGMKHIPVDRRAGLGSLQAAVEALRRGEIVGVFPEATMSLSFELKEFKTGAARMAQEAGVPILPATVWGSQRVWTKHVPKNLRHSRIPIYVTIGAPMHVGPDPGGGARQGGARPHAHGRPLQRQEGRQAGAEGDEPPQAAQAAPPGLSSFGPGGRTRLRSGHVLRGDFVMGVTHVTMGG